MWQIFGKDIKQFFGSFNGILTLMAFAVVAGLFFWYLEGPYNLLFSGFADLTPVFRLLPWLLIFVLPAVSMRSFSEEYRAGTAELLLTKPVSTSRIIAGKIAAVFFIGLLMILPLGIYLLGLKALMMPGERIDRGIILAALTGLLLLIAIFSATGVWVSSLTRNQTGAYLGGVFVLFLLYYGFYGLASFQWVGSADYFLRRLSLAGVYERLTGGLMDWNAVAYLLFLVLLFGWLGVLSVNKRQK